MGNQRTPTQKTNWWQELNIRSEQEYHQVTDQLASELLKDHSPGELAEIAAQHLIYVSELEKKIAALEDFNATLKKVAQTTGEITEIQRQNILELSESSASKLSVREVARFTKLALDAFRHKTAKKRMSGLDQINDEKERAIARAKEIAAQKWLDTRDQKIRIGAMADLVYRQLVSEGFQNALPAKTESLKAWISSVAPVYASTHGRPGKAP